MSNGGRLDEAIDLYSRTLAGYERVLGPDHPYTLTSRNNLAAAYRAKHRYNRADPAVQQLFRETSVYATWDDHEVANNFAGSLEPLMPVGRRAFRDYWGIEGPREEPDRLYRSVRWGRGLEVFMLDTRQYRSGNAEPDGPDKTMLGDDKAAEALLLSPKGRIEFAFRLAVLDAIDARAYADELATKAGT